MIWTSDGRTVRPLLVIEAPADSMIERAARAAWEENRRRNPVFGIETWDRETEALREDWRAFMRAAIAAMREPTSEMMRAGGGAMLRTTRPLHNALDSWNAMIDEALR